MRSLPPFATKSLQQIHVMPGVLSSLPGNVTKPILLNYLEVERLVMGTQMNTAADVFALHPCVCTVSLVWRLWDAGAAV